MLKKLLICCSSLNIESTPLISFEIQTLLDRSHNYYEKTILVDPLKIKHIIDPHKNTSGALFKEEVITDATSLIVRNTQNCEESIRILVINLFNNHCEFLDPVERFTGEPAVKSAQFFLGLKNKTTPSTFITFTKESAIELLPYIEETDLFPIIGKPSSGKQGLHVELLTNSSVALGYINDFYNRYKGLNTGLILQKYIDIVHEYRVLLLDGKSIGIVEKMPSGNSVARNASLGSKFIVSDSPEIEAFAEKNGNSKGLVGLDIAFDSKNDTYLIESNRSPQWKVFQEVTGVNVADKIFISLEKRLKSNRELF